MSRSRFSQAMRAGSAADLPAFEPGAGGQNGHVIEGFFGECLCGALIIAEGGIEFDWQFGVYPRTRHHCSSSLQAEVAKLKPEAKQDVTPQKTVTPTAPPARGVLNLGE